MTGEPGHRGVQRRVGHVEVGHCRYRVEVEVEAGNLAGDSQEVCQVQVLDPHLARRSRSSRSSSMMRRSRFLNSGSARRRSTASTSAERTVSLTLFPSTRASASASRATSSGNRTVKFLVMVSCYHCTVSVDDRADLPKAGEHEHPIWTRGTQGDGRAESRQIDG
jgi:hypothetical protein